MTDVASSSQWGHDGPTLGDLVAQHAQPKPPAPVAPAPAPVIPSDPAAAMARLAELKADAGWRDKFLSGDGPQVKEYRALEAVAAKSTNSQVDRAIAGQLDDAPFQPSGHMEMIGTAAMLKEVGFGPTAVREVLTGQKFTEADVEKATQWKSGALRNKEWTARFLEGDQEAAREMLAANAVISNGSAA